MFQWASLAYVSLSFKEILQKDPKITICVSVSLIMLFRITHIKEAEKSLVTLGLGCKFESCGFTMHALHFVFFVTYIRFCHPSAEMIKIKLAGKITR